MVLMAQPYVDAYESIRKLANSITVMLTPQGVPLNDKLVNDLTGYDQMILLCGHYEGYDERIREIINPLEISVGDFVLTGGELPALCLIDAVSRKIDGTLGCLESADEDSFSNGLLEYPHYTHPLEFDGKTVPDVLLSGNDVRIKEWRQKQAIIETIKHRPDLFDEIPSESTGCSGARVLVFDSCVLKIQKEGPQSRRELEAMLWLKGRLPVPDVLHHSEKDGLSYILMTRLKGRMLCDPKILHNRSRLLKSAAAAMKMLWAVDVSDCPFRSEAGDCKDPVLSHGDFCLPNIFADNRGITGFIDLGYCTVGSRQNDMDTCLESLEANLTGRFSDGMPEEPLDRSLFLSLLQ